MVMVAVVAVVVDLATLVDRLVALAIQMQIAVLPAIPAIQMQIAILLVIHVIQIHVIQIHVIQTDTQEV